MFTSNQILDVICDARDLPKVLQFATDLDDALEFFTRSDGRITPAFAEPVPGVYAIGKGTIEPFTTGANAGHGHGVSRGWTDYPFSWDPEIVSGILRQWLEKNPPDPATKPCTDGCVRPGFRIRSLESISPELPPYHEIMSRWDCWPTVVCVTPCWLRYDK